MRITSGNLIIACCFFLASPFALAQVDMSPDCPPVAHNFGPFDYRTADQEKKGLVEGAHFLPQVENLIKGYRGYLGGDIDYTLRVFPNHPRALLSMMRLAEKEKTKTPQGARSPVHCYFEYGVRFRPDDSAVRMLYGIFLLKQGNNVKALEQLDEAGKLDDSDPNISYNMGLAYFKLKKYDQALKYAHKAYESGFPLPGLRDALKREGKWAEPKPVVNEVQSEPVIQP